MLYWALQRRHNISCDCTWVSCVRSHYNIGWAFSNTDARKLGKNPISHRRFLNTFFINQHASSFDNRQQWIVRDQFIDVPEQTMDLVSGYMVNLREGMQLRAHQYIWLYFWAREGRHCRTIAAGRILKIVKSSSRMFDFLSFLSTLSPSDRSHKNHEKTFFNHMAIITAFHGP